MKNNIEQRSIKTNDTIQERILPAIRANPKISQTQMAKEIGVSADTIKYHIRKMREEQIIAREGTSQKGKCIILE